MHSHSIELTSALATSAATAANYIETVANTQELSDVQQLELAIPDAPFYAIRAAETSLLLTSEKAIALAARIAQYTWCGHRWDWHSWEPQDIAQLRSVLQRHVGNPALQPITRHFYLLERKADTSLLDEPGWAALRSNFRQNMPDLLHRCEYIRRGHWSSHCLPLQRWAWLGNPGEPFTSHLENGLTPMQAAEQNTNNKAIILFGLLAPQTVAQLSPKYRQRFKHLADFQTAWLHTSFDPQGPLTASFGWKHQAAGLANAGIDIAQVSARCAGQTAVWGTAHELKRTAVPGAGLYYLDNFRIWHGNGPIGTKRLVAVRLNEKLVMVNQPTKRTRTDSHRTIINLRSWLHHHSLTTLVIEIPEPEPDENPNQTEYRARFLQQLCLAAIANWNWAALSAALPHFQPEEIPEPIRKLLQHAAKTQEMRALIDYDNKDLQTDFDEHTRRLLDSVLSNTPIPLEPATLARVL